MQSMSASSSILTVAPFLAEQVGRQEFLGGGGKGRVCMGKGHVPVPLAATRVLLRWELVPRRSNCFLTEEDTVWAFLSPTKVSRGR